MTKAARILSSIRALSDTARADIRAHLGPEFDGLGLQDLNPRTLARKAWQNTYTDAGFADVGHLMTDVREDFSAAVSGARNSIGDATGEIPHDHARVKVSLEKKDGDE